jgi:hypothetical protein
LLKHIGCYSSLKLLNNNLRYKLQNILVHLKEIALKIFGLKQQKFYCLLVLETEVHYQGASMTSSILRLLTSACKRPS